MTISLQVPNQDQAGFLRLFHHTSLLSAYQILSSLKIFGADTHSHANFFASKQFQNKDLDLPRSTEVCLEFFWIGPQIVIDAWPNDGQPFIQGNAGPMLYHIITKNPPDYNNWSIAQCNYWQSIVYPGSNHLRFKNWTLNMPSSMPVKNKFQLAGKIGLKPKPSAAQQSIAIFQSLAAQAKAQAQGQGAIVETITKI